MENLEPVEALKVLAERGGIDVWVNNAGVEYNGPAEDLSRRDWDETLNVMVSGTFFCSQAVGRHMLAAVELTVQPGDPCLMDQTLQALAVEYRLLSVDAGPADRR